MKAEIGHISTMGRLRKADPKQVAGIAESIKEVGLLNPITVVLGKVIFNGQKIDGYQLVAGLHRLEACKSLGWADIPIAVLDLDEQQRIIAECDENLCGSVLTATERAMFSARRKEAYEALHPETRHGHNTKESGQVGHSSFADDQSAKTGQSARAIRRDAERGQQVCKEALDILKGTKADTGVVLDAIKDLDPAAQVVAAYREVQKRQEPVKRSTADDAQKSRASKIDGDVKDRAAKEVAEIIAEHVPGEWWDGVKANLYAAGARNIADALTNITGQSLMDKGGWE
ncbi:ParB N-terminal domain-containing protein [Paracoccus aminovorans]|uniref:ParB N-terminal domain-containing protein n=1 Tax=Paracoccus aminovorans TaxID=34004 RepID=UPI000780231F|nr:ParB N-terminal domain-containing protein [Paracoccus aminovorans]